jgi:lysosomal alpha-mannosidase
LYALNNVNRTWTSKTDDFFPYAIFARAYLTGFYTSRPALKRYERYSNNVLQMTRQLNAFSNVNMRNSTFPLSKTSLMLFFTCLLVNISVIGEAMGLIQHHDAISGTERQHVADDYVQRLSEGIDAAIVSDKNRKMIFFSFIMKFRNEIIFFTKY